MTVLARRAAATPDRTALVDAADGRRWRYRDLDGAVERAAARLQRRASEADTQGSTGSPRVGTLFEPTPAFVVTFHAVQRLGWTVVGLDTRLPDTELDTRVEQADTDLLVYGDSPEPSVGRPAVDVSELVDLSGEGSGDRRQAFEHQAPPVSGGSTDRAEAVILFTSGTTGAPKAVRLTRGNLRASAVASAFRLGVSPGDRWLCCLPVHHMGGLAPVLRTAIHGTALVVQRGFDAGGTARALGTHDITGVSLVPTQLRRLLDADAPLSALETVLVGGAPTPRSLLSRALDAGVPVYPTYGLTEAASQVATARPSTAQAHPETVGQPLYGVEVTVLADGEPADPGQRGELVVDGPTVSPGYLDPAATEAATSGWGLHTDDVGYRDEDGRLWVLGRRDDLLLTGGELVAPHEVAGTLCSHPDIADAAVVGLEDPEWGQRLAALVVPAGDIDAPAIDPAAVDEYCRAHLPGYKRPKTVVLADSLPRTVSGTVDRKAVRERLRAARE